MRSGRLGGLGQTERWVGNDLSSALLGGVQRRPHPRPSLGPRPGPNMPPLPMLCARLRLGITGPKATLTLSADTEGATPFSCTGLGDGKITCTGPIEAPDFFIPGGMSLNALAAELDAIGPYIGPCGILSPRGRSCNGRHERVSHRI